MGRAPCCDKATVKRGPWSPEEDAVLRSHIEEYGTGGNWITLPKKAGLNRCGKSCRLRWLNYLRPDIKHGGFTEEEDNIICSLYRKLGSRWSVIASHLRGRTDNDVKNYWNTKLKKKLLTPTIITSIIPSPTPASLLPTVKAEPYNNPSDISRSVDSIFALTQDSHEFYLEPSPLPTQCRANETGQLHRHSRSEEVSATSSTFTVDDGSRNSYGNWSASGAGPYDLFLSELDIEYLTDLLGDDGCQAEVPQGLHRSVAYW